MNGNNIASQGSTWIIADTPYIYGDIGSYTAWKIGNINNGYPDLIPTNTYYNGSDLTTLVADSYGYTFYLYPANPCFLEGTKILCLIDDKEVYVPIETMKPGTLVKTSRDGYKKLKIIGKGEIFNPRNDERSENRLYKCSTENYPELTEDLYITGCHSILVDSITDIERENTIAKLGKIFITDKKYRLMACIDERAKPWINEDIKGDKNGVNYTIWHIALEHEDIKMNYGVYANGGLLVETCSLNFLTNRSSMTIESIP